MTDENENVLEAPVAPKHMIEVHIKSLPYQPRGKAGEYRAGSVQILEAEEAYELDKAGIAIITQDPYVVATPQEPFEVYLPGPDIVLTQPQAPGAPGGPELVVENENGEGSEGDVDPNDPPLDGDSNAETVDENGIVGDEKTEEESDKDSDSKGE